MISRTDRFRWYDCLLPLAALALLAAPSLAAHSDASSTQLLGIPVDVRASDGTYDDRIRIEWSPVSTASEYEILRSTRAQGAFSPLVVTTNLWYEDTQLLPSQSYDYQVRALADSVVGPASEPDLGFWSFLPPASVSASKAAFPDRIRVSWSPVQMAQYDYLYRSRQIDGPYVLIGMIRECWYEDEGIPPGRSFFYKLRSLTSSTASNLSDSAAGLADATLTVPWRFLSLTATDSLRQEP